MWWLSSNEKRYETDAERPDADVEPASLPSVDLGSRSASHAPAHSESATDRDEIRIHDDENAARTADEIGAAAYTRGRDIYFAAGKYAPDTEEGRRLLAHEIAHAIHNAPTVESTKPVSDSDVVAASDVTERDADSFARSAPSGGGARATARSSSGDSTAIHRAPSSETETVHTLRSALRDSAPDGREVVTMLRLLDREPGCVEAIKRAYTAAFGAELERDVREALDGEWLAEALRLLHVVGMEPLASNHRPRAHG